ncbi:MAG: hypothetical protein ACRC46_10655 [Thermoguttaceae bacterium]
MQFVRSQLLLTFALVVVLNVAGKICAQDVAQTNDTTAKRFAGIPQRLIPPVMTTPLFSRDNTAPSDSVAAPRDATGLPGFDGQSAPLEYTFAPYGSLESSDGVRVAAGATPAIPSPATSPPNTATPAPIFPSISGNTLGGATPFRRIRLNSRSDQPMDIISDVDAVTGRSVVLVSNGVNIIIEGVSASSPLVGQIIDISADRAAIWATQLDGMRRDTEHVQDDQQEMECYVEGNIVFRDGLRTIFADQMYYDAKNKIGYIKNGEVLMPIAENNLRLEGVARLKAEVLRQHGDGQFSATNSLMTTSLLGVPSYSLRSRNLTLKEVATRPTSTSASPTKSWAVAENNFIYARECPVFYWPWMASSLDEPTLYIKNFFYAYDGVFGHQVRTTWNPFQLFNIRRRPDGCDWDISLDYLSLRGFGAGTSLAYDRDNCFGLGGKTRGAFNFWGIYDTGFDNLGLDRRHVSFPNPFRYEFYWKHRQAIGISENPWIATARAGMMSDRNFRKQYDNIAWLTEENRTTMLELKKTKDDHSLGLGVEYALDKSVTNSNWLPRLDHYVLGRSLLHDYLTSYSHIRAGFVQYKTASAPDDISDLALFDYLPWEVTTDGTKTIDTSAAVVSLRHEIDLPLSLGPLRTVPFAVGDFAFWGSDRTGKSADRAYGQFGVRLNLPFVKVNPAASNRLWYLNGLAHKVDFDAEFSYATTNRHYENLILFDPLDDWSTDDARRRFDETTFGGAILPTMYDPRNYAIRSGLLNTVTSPSSEVLDSMSLVRLGMTHRWQTKRGPVARRNIIDWITFSTHANIYPEKAQNYGQNVGFIDYNLTWHVGDRFSILSSGLFDPQEHGQRIVRVGGLTSKPGRSSLYVGVDSFSGAFDRTYLSLALQYTMNKKYAMTYSTAYDFNRGKNVGHQFKFSRTGESFRLIAGVVYNESRNDWGFNLSLEPVFLYGLSSAMLGR